MLLAALAALTVAPDGAAAPQSGAATRAELTRWLEQLRADGADVAAPLPWQYSFSASAAARLESLSVALVSRGYAIESLGPGAAGGTDLLVTRVELLTPTALERRNRELAALARQYGVRYDGVDLAAGKIV
jgi:hypothetical protein